MGHVILLHPLPSNRPPGAQSKRKKSGVCIRVANGLSLLWFHVDLLPSLLWCCYIYLEHSFQMFCPFLILHFYYDVYLLIHLHFPNGVYFISRSIMPVLTWATDLLREPIHNAPGNNQLLMLILIQDVWGGAWASSLVTSPQEMLIQLIHGPHFEEQVAARFENGL